MIANQIKIAPFALLCAITALGSAFELPASSALPDAELVTTTRTETFNIFGSQSLTLTATVTLPISEPTGANCGETLPGLVLYPCIVRSTVLSHPHNIDLSVIMTYWPINTTNTITTTETVTSIPIASTTTKTVSQIDSMNAATGLCFWAEQNILTPCTGLVAATSTSNKTSAAIHAYNNVFRGATSYAKSSLDNKVVMFKYTLAYLQTLRARDDGLFPRYGQCAQIPFLLTPAFSQVLSIIWSLVIFYLWSPNNMQRNRILEISLLVWVTFNTLFTYVEFDYGMRP